MFHRNPFVRVTMALLHTTYSVCTRTAWKQASCLSTCLSLAVAFTTQGAAWSEQHLWGGSVVEWRGRNWRRGPGMLSGALSVWRKPRIFTENRSALGRPASTLPLHISHACLEVQVQSSVLQEGGDLEVKWGGEIVWAWKTEDWKNFLNWKKIVSMPSNENEHRNQRNLWESVSRKTKTRRMREVRERDSS